MTVTDDTLRLIDQARTEVEAITDRQVSDIAAGWARAWDEVAADLHAALLELTTAAGEDRVTRAMILRPARLTRALAAVADALQTAADAASVTIVGDLPAVVRNAGDLQASIITSQLPAGEHALVTVWSQVDVGAVQAIVRRSTTRIHALTRPLADDAVRAMKRELIRGVATGAGPAETARRMLRRSEAEFNGGATRALTIARTEMLDASRASSAVAQQANADVLAGWAWSATLSPRTCPACWAMDGTVWPLEQPGPEGHQNCRCARLPVTKPWTELGLDHPEPPSVITDKAKAFAALSAEDQRRILGPGRYAAWADGRFPIDKWAVRRSTDGWRDSYVPAPVPGARSTRLAS